MGQLTTSRSIFTLHPMFDRLPGPMGGMLRAPLEGLLGFGKLNAAYDRAMSLPHHQFCQSALEALNVTVKIAQPDLDRIPRTGPLMVVANHPYGGIEGVIMASVLLRIRPDTKLLANHLLSLIPQMNDICIFVNPFESQRGCTMNIKGLKQSLRWLNDGGVLGVFPAGEVSSLQLGQRRVSDPHWNEQIAGMARRTGATVLPMFFDGRNGALFQMAGLVHPRLRTALLPRELVNGKRGEVVVQVGNPILPAELMSFPDEKQCVRYMRLRTYALAGRAERQGKWRSITAKWRATLPQGLGARSLEPIVAPAPVNAIAAEFEALPPRALLGQTGDLAVYVIPGGRRGAIMHEVGRLREETFRSVGEGTGKSLDLDQFDDWYDQLVLWDRAKQRIAGGYRIGATDRVDPVLGHGSLYINTLFQLHPQFLRRLSPAVELGRSFVCPEYQRGFTSLLLLWKGVCTYIHQRPWYKYIYGAVSVSADYSMLSRALIVEFLSRPGQRSRLTPLVTPRNRFVPNKQAKSEALELAHLVRDLDELNQVISDIEPDGKGVPILLKQYLRLGSKPVSFNVDPAFGDCLDVFVVVDLPRAEVRQIDRYMGKTQAAWYRANHGVHAK